MNFQASQRRERTRERIAISALSLLILLVLVGGYAYLRSSQEPIGKLSVISTSEVTISVNEALPATVAPDSAAPATPTQTPVRPAASGRGPNLAAEVFGASEQADASASSQQAAPAAGQAGGGQQASARATATVPSATGTPRTGIVPQIGSTNSSGGEPAAQPTPTRPPVTSTSAPGGGSTPVPATSTLPPSNPTQAAAAPTAVPTQQSGGDDVPTPIGHHSHLHIEGFAGPGAYTTGGIIVTNVGEVAFNYSVSMSTSGSQTFAALLRMRIYLRVGTSCNYPGQPSSPATGFLPLAGDQVGTVLYDGTFASGNKIGDPTVELAAGDRHLEPGQSEVLCMEVFFPWTAGNEYQGLSVNGTQVFTAKSPE